MHDRVHAHSRTQMQARHVHTRTNLHPLPHPHPHPHVHTHMLTNASTSGYTCMVHVQGVHAWCPLRSARGETVGALQLGLTLTHVDGRPLDLCHAAPAPLQQVPALCALLGADAVAQLLPVAPLPPPSQDLMQSSGEELRFWAGCPEAWGAARCCSPCGCCSLPLIPHPVPPPLGMIRS